MTPFIRLSSLTTAVILSCSGASTLATDFSIPAAVKAKYAYLKQVPVETLPNGVLGFGKARRFLREGIHVLYLTGDRYEMAYQHGRLMREEILQGALPSMTTALHKIIVNTIGDIPVITDFVSGFYYRTITEKIYKSSLASQFPDTDLPLADGYALSEATGISMKDLVYSAIGPETLTVLLGQNLAEASPNQCSAFAAWGSHTSDGELLMGRNTDYPLNGKYDRFPTVIYFNPTNGTQRYMAVTSAGLHNAGVVGANESGIYLDVHTIPTLDVSTERIPVFMIAQEVLRRSKTLQEAVEYFKPFKPAAGWSYLVVSTKERKAAVIDLSANGMGVRYPNKDYLIQTNHYLSSEMKSKFTEVNPSTVSDTLNRYRRIEDRLTELGPKLDPIGVASIMGDKWDPENKAYRVLGNTVANHTTMTSVVVQPARNRIFVGNSTAPVSQNTFVEFPFVQMEPNTFNSSSYETFPNHSFKQDFPTLAQAEQFFIQSKIAYEEELNTQKSISLLKKAIALDASSPGMQFILGVLNLKTKNWIEAETAFDVLTRTPQPHYRMLAHYYLGRLHGHRGRGEKATREFETVLRDANPEVEAKLKEASQRLLKRVEKVGFARFGLMELSLMFQQADMINY